MQKNKVRKIIGRCTLIHSVDSIELAQKISECSIEMKVITRILLQVNTSGERNKQGMSVAECQAACQDFLSLPNLAIEGLMTIAPLTQESEILHDCFSELKRLQQDLRKAHEGTGFHILSMGMSNDYSIAIAEGATLLRIGSLNIQSNCLNKLLLICTSFVTPPIVASDLLINKNSLLRSKNLSSLHRRHN